MDQQDKTYLWMAVATLVFLLLGCIFAYSEKSDLVGYNATPVKF